MPLPLTDTISSAKLRGFDSITFDPLGVAAVLSNPRADLSAARLYVQSDRRAFQWPHTTMIGEKLESFNDDLTEAESMTGALTPLATLVDHLAGSDSIHPAVSMCARDEKSLDIKSNTIIRPPRINVSNLWLRDVVDFKPSKEPLHISSASAEHDDIITTKSGRADNDFAIANVKHVFDQSALQKTESKDFGTQWRLIVINLTGYTTGLVLAAAMVFSILTGDLWAIVLFFLYFSHWIASTLISFTHLVEPTCPKIRQDETIRFLVYERSADVGGTVVFKGTQHELETWARTTLQFRRELLSHLLHWFWIITGSLSAIASVATMVNMSGKFQLVFLGVLFYSSVAELWLTQAARYIQGRKRKSAGLGKIRYLRENKTRTEAIIRTTICMEEECNLKDLDWIGLELLPPTPIFKQFQTMIKTIADGGSVSVESTLEDFRRLSNPKAENIALVERIINEVRTVIDEAESQQKSKIEA